MQIAKERSLIVKKYQGLVVGLLSLLSLLALVAFGVTSQAAEKINVVTTFYPMYEFSKAIVGDEGQVDLLIKAGNEPHDYEPSAKDMAKISDADIFVYNSNQLEKWAQKMEQVDPSKTKVVEAAAGIKLAKGAKNSEEAGELDPHVWLDPVLAKQEVATIEKALAEKYPAKAAVFEQNQAKYDQKLDQLDHDYQTKLQGAKQRSIITQHAAFGYLAKRYGLKQEAIAGLSPDQEPSPSRLASLKKYVKNHKIKLIYFEENTTSKVAKTLAEETGVKTAVLDPIEGIPQKEIQHGATYLSIMKQNLTNLKKTIK